MERHPADGGIDPDTPAEFRLAGRIRSLIARIADPDSHFFAIVHKEMMQQTRLLEKILVQEINPERQVMNSLIRELLGGTVTEQQIQYCHASIVGQCFHLLKIKHLKISPENQSYILDMRDADAYAEHVVQFSLAGIQAIRAANQQQREIE